MTGITGSDIRSRAASVMAAATLLVSFAGCADGSDDAWDGTITTLPSGARLVQNPATGVWRSGEAWRVEEELRIGSSVGDGPDVFSVVFALDSDDAGNIYAFDTMSRELRVFGHDGTHLRSYGRQGGGPGEFEAVIGLRVREAGETWIVDMQNARYTVLRADSVAVHPRPAGMYRPPWIGGFTADGVFHDVAAIRDGEVLIRVAPDGTVQDSVWLPFPDLPQPRRGSITFDLPFGPQHLRAFDPTGAVWTATSHEYRLHRVTLAGDTILTVTHPQTPRPLAPEARDSVTRYARMLENEVRLTVSSDMIPREAPVLQWLAVDDRGYLWVGLAGAEDEPTQADIYDGDGRYLGRLVLPFTSMQALPPRFRNGRLYTMTEDALGSPVIMRARIDGRRD